MNLKDLMAAALLTLETEGCLAVVELLTTQDPQHAAEIYLQAQLDSYWQRKSLPAVIALSHAGIQHALGAAVRTRDPEASAALRGSAMALAYNLASFTWPGWNEPDILLTPADIALGRDAAHLNLRLAEERQALPRAKANAHWILGAHELAAGKLARAAAAFQAGKSHAAEGDDPLLTQMLEGYLLLTDVLTRQPPNPGAKRLFEAHLSALHEEGSEDAREYATQLSTALSVFCP